MRLRNFLKMGGMTLFFSLFLFSCNQAENKDGKHGKDNEGTGSTLRPINLKIKTSSSPIKWDFATKNGNDFTIEIPASITSIEKTDIEAFFEWDGMKAPKPRKLDFNVEGGFPIKLAEPATPKVVKMTVPADSNEKYSEFKNSVTIIRKKVSDTKLKKIRLQSTTFTKTEITDFTTSNEVETNSQSVNVFFYSDVSATAEDVELIGRITTEPALVKVGMANNWKLNDVHNELKVKLDGNDVYTVKVKRNPLLIGSVGVYANGNEIVKDAEEGKSYDTASGSIEIAVFPKKINNGYLTYKKVTVKVGNTQEVELKQPNNPKPDDSFFGVINLGEGDNAITITVIDPTEKDDFKVSRVFTIKKDDTDPSTGPIDASVKIAELYVGDGDMATLGVNKFKAEKDSSDDHKYTVHVSKKYKDQKVSLIVKGDVGATTADIKDMDGTATTPAKADGVATFVSTKDYLNVKANGKKYVFMLENGGKKALYEITCVFDVAVKNTITITKPEHGTINAYLMKAGVRTPLTISSSNTIEVETGTFVFFELVADTGKKPKKLVVDVTEHTEVTTGVVGQTTGAIAVKVKVEKNFSVTGECAD